MFFKSSLNRSIGFIVLPLIAFCALSAYFLIDRAPKMIKAERRAITEEYRENAETIVTDSAAANWHGEREKGWRQISKIDRKYPWGVIERADGRTLVWVENPDKTMIGLERETIGDYSALWIYGGFGFVIGFVLFVAGFGIVLLKKYDRERESFLAGMVHDLRNPLVAIRGIVKRDPDYAADLAESMLAMVRNAQAFLGFCGRRSEAIETFDIVPMIKSAYRLFEDGFTDEESGAVEFTLPEKLEVRGIVEETRQILWNLFSNAAKYAAPYGSVKVKAYAKDDFAAVEFADQGLGMTPRQMRRAFDRLYRAAGLHECGKGGFGLGLYASRAAARRMGGDITVEKNLPKGCVFVLKLKH